MLFEEAAEDTLILFWSLIVVFITGLMMRLYSSTQAFPLELLGRMYGHRI